ncbi:MAG: helix-turn-helix transcriptional regulator [Clostridia bacterium]|nr:helix-turn-helix transcriptional regulator [Clostridia bacterium]
MNISKLKSEMKRQKITYPKLAELTGISLSAISKIFSGIATNPRAETIAKIEEALGLQSSDIARPYLTEQEEYLLHSFKNLSKENKTLVLTLCKKIELSERR